MSKRSGVDEVVGHFGYDDVEHGAYACAVAIHCDLGSPQTGIIAGRAVWDQAEPGAGKCARPRLLGALRADR